MRAPAANEFLAAWGQTPRQSCYRHFGYPTFSGVGSCAGESKAHATTGRLELIRDSSYLHDGRAYPRFRNGAAIVPVGPAPAPERSIASVMACRSVESSVSVAAGTHPSTWLGDRAPTMAPVTPGQLSTQAMATAAMVVS